MIIPKTLSLSIVIPVFNEENSILSVLDSVFKYIQNVHEVIVVNDGSTDRTADLVRNIQDKYTCLRLINHPKNKGKTEALKTGFAVSTGDIVIVQDADLEYDPSEIPNVIEPIKLNKADVVYGSRFLVRQATRVLYYRHYLANRLFTNLMNLFTDINFSDVETCYKAFRGDIIRNMIITSKGFGFEIEVTAKIAKLKCRIYEVPISYYGRTYQEGKKIGVRDGIYALYCIVRYTFFISLKDSFTTIPKMNI